MQAENNIFYIYIYREKERKKRERDAKMERPYEDIFANFVDINLKSLTDGEIVCYVIAMLSSLSISLSKKEDYFLLSISSRPLTPSTPPSASCFPPRMSQEHDVPLARFSRAILNPLNNAPRLFPRCIALVPAFILS